MLRHRWRSSPRQAPWQAGKVGGSDRRPPVAGRDWSLELCVSRGFKGITLACGEDVTLEELQMITIREA